MSLESNGVNNRGGYVTSTESEDEEEREDERAVIIIEVGSWSVGFGQQRQDYGNGNLGPK